MKLRKRKGFALMTVLFVVIILSIFFISIITITQSNTKQVRLQEDNLRAYYLARSGVDIAYAALMEEESGEQKLDQFIRGSDDELTHLNLALPDKANPIGHVDIKVLKIDDEVRINAVAKTLKGPGNSSLSLYIYKDDYSRTRWVKE